MKNVKRILLWLTIAATVAAVIDQLRLPSSQRNWQGEVFGVPYDFRRPTFGRIKSRWWNPDDPRLFTPRAFGVGWDVNLHRLLRLARQAKE